MIFIKPIKKDLNHAIKWSSSRYNEKKKIDVIKEILFLVEKGEDATVEFTTGSYCESGHLGGWDYILSIKEGNATLTEIAGSSPLTYHIHKPKTNKLFTGAERFKVVEVGFPWHRDIVGMEFEIEKETPDSFYFQYKGKEHPSAINKKFVVITK